MALKIVTGGTTGAADGTLVSSGDPIVITALNTAVNAHIRCDDGYWTATETFDVPAELQVSFDGGTTWYGNADEPITAPEIYAVNYPIKVRQTTAASSTSGWFATNNSTYTAIATLANVTNFAATVGNAQVALSWSAVTGATSYQVDRATDSGFTTGVSNGIYTGSGTSYTDTGRTNNTAYYYRIKAVSTNGRYTSPSASYATANGTPGTFTDAFGRTSTDTLGSNWTALQSTLTGWGTNGTQGTCASTGAGVRKSVYFNGFQLADCLAAVKLPDNTLIGGVGVIARIETATPKFYLAYLTASGNQALIYYFNGTTYSQLAVGNPSGGYANNDVLGLKCVGTTLTVMKNGVSTGISATDSTLTSGYAGVFRDQNSSGTLPFDDFSLTAQ